MGKIDIKFETLMTVTMCNHYVPITLKPIVVPREARRDPQAVDSLYLAHQSAGEEMIANLGRLYTYNCLFL